MKFIDGFKKGWKDTIEDLTIPKEELGEMIGSGAVALIVIAIFIAIILIPLWIFR